MLEKPKFKTQFRVEIIEGKGIFLLSENSTVFLSDRIYQALCPLLDGSRTVDEIVEQLQEQLPAAYIYYALMELEHQGFLIESEMILPINIVVFIENLNVNIKDAYSRLRETKVTVKALGSLSASGFIDILNSLPIQIAEEANFEVVITDDYLHPELAEINQKNQMQSRPWMLVKPLGTSLWIGPIFDTSQTGCWECLSQRLEGNRPIEKFIQRHKNPLSPLPLTPPLADLPSTQQTALTMAATELLKWIIQGENKSLEGVLITYNTLTSETRKHPLIKRPQCNCCGILKPEHRQPLPVILGSRKKNSSLMVDIVAFPQKKPLSDTNIILALLQELCESWENFLKTLMV